jgi:RimJ/RimL family protein N-acetyltransferase
MGTGRDPARRPHELFDRFLSWQGEDPRRNFQVGIFATDSGRLCGSCGLRRSGASDRAAVLGIELMPDDWGRYRLASDVASALIEYAFVVFDVDWLIAQTASRNRRVERLARRFGVEIVARREGPDWMAARGWVEVDWALDRDGCMGSRHRE